MILRPHIFAAHDFHMMPRYGRSRAALAAACVLIGLAFLAGGFAAAQQYPLPKPKPRVVSFPELRYPLPEPNPRRKIGLEEATPAPSRQPVRKAKRPTGSRADEAGDATAPAEPAKTWSSSEVASARAACKALLKDVVLTFTEAEPFGGPGECGIAAPIKVTAIGARKSVKVDPPAILNCALAAAAVRWMDKKIQVPALAELGETVVEIRNAASYACRRRNNKKDGKLSEHALGNALDVSSFTLSSGKIVSVLKGWRGQKNDSLIEQVVSKVVPRETAESRFLKHAHAGACEVFSTILGPEADQYHVDHFHLDLGRGGRYLVCR
jgi:hypothetical protein